MFSKSAWRFLPVIAVLSAFLIWLTAAAGIGATPDSANYLAAARAFAEHGELTILSGKPLVWWPPLYPMAWGAFLAIGFQPFTAALGLNLLSFTAFAWAWASIFENGLCPPRSSHRSRVWWWPWILMLACYGNLHLFAHSTSEPGFLALMAWAILALIRYEPRRKPSHLILAAVIAGAACLWRYPGVALVLAGSLFLFLRTHTWSQRFKTVAIWLTISLAPLTLWFFRNWLVAGTLTGTRNLPPYSGLTNLKASSFAVLRWLFNGPHLSRNVSLAIAGVLLLTLAAFLGTRRFSRTQGSQSRHTPPARKSSIPALVTNSGHRTSLFLICFVVIYATSSWFLASVSFTSYPNARLISPIMAPLMFLIAKGAIAMWGQPVKTTVLQRFLAWTTPIAALAYLAIGVVQINTERQHGWGIHTLAWQRSPLIQAVGKLPGDARIYTNFRTELYLHTARDRPGLPRALSELNRFREAKRPNGIYVAWSTLPKGQRKQYGIQTLIQTLQPDSMTTFEDGWLMYLAPHPKSREPGPNRP